MKTKKLLMLLLVLALALALALAACGAPAEEAEEAAEEAAEETAEETPAGPITITDMSGDEVTIEGEVKSIVNLWPGCTTSFFAMGAGDLISGLAINSPAVMNAWTQTFYPGCVDIPALGGTTPAVEELATLAPDLVIVHPSSAKDGYAQQVREIGIPAINIFFKNYDSMKESYTLLGQILGGEYQSKLEDWCADVSAKQARNQEMMADLADEDKPIVYYIAGQEESLTVTMGQGSIIQDWVESCGGRFAPAVMNLDGEEVTAEEIFELNPDVIIVGGTYQHVLLKQLQETDGWKDLNAVKNGRVYNNPYGCYNWERFGLESCLQLDYALTCIQPELAAEAGIDRDFMVKDVIDFYAKYNGTELTEEQANFMLDGLLPDGSAEIPAE